MKNPRGFFYTIASVRNLLAAIKKRDWIAIFEAIKRLVILSAGLSIKGSSDLIGWKTITITENDIGRQIAIFTAIEVKTIKGVIRPEQEIFINNVIKAGGIAGIARSPEDAIQLLSEN